MAGAPDRGEAAVLEPSLITPTLRRRGRLAQLVEHLLYTQGVGGSIPSPPIAKALLDGPLPRRSQQPRRSPRPSPHRRWCPFVPIQRPDRDAVRSAGVSRSRRFTAAVYVRSASPRAASRALDRAPEDIEIAGRGDERSLGLSTPRPRRGGIRVIEHSCRLELPRFTDLPLCAGEGGFLPLDVAGELRPLLLELGEALLGRSLRRRLKGRPRCRVRTRGRSARARRGRERGPVATIVRRLQGVGRAALEILLREVRVELEATQRVLALLDRDGARLDCAIDERLGDRAAASVQTRVDRFQLPLETIRTRAHGLLSRPSAQLRG